MTPLSEIVADSSPLMRPGREAAATSKGYLPIAMTMVTVFCIISGVSQLSVGRIVVAAGGSPAVPGLIAALFVIFIEGMHILLWFLSATLILLGSRLLGTALVFRSSLSLTGVAQLPLLVWAVVVLCGIMACEYGVSHRAEPFTMASVNSLLGLIAASRLIAYCCSYLYLLRLLMKALEVGWWYSVLATAPLVAFVALWSFAGLALGGTPR